MTKVGAEVKAKGFSGLQDQHRDRDRRQDPAPTGRASSSAAASPSATGTPSSRAVRRRPSRPSARAAGRMSASCSTPTSISAPKGFRRIAEAVGPTKLTWLELDAHDPKSIALIRRDSPCPIASGETLLERRDFRPYFEAYAFDTAIVDVVWNGFYESLKIAAMAEVYEVNVAPHNFYGHLAVGHQRAFLRRRAELPHHGDRHRQREMARRVRHNRAGLRERRLRAADRPGLGRRGQRGRRSGAAAKNYVISA